MSRGGRDFRQPGMLWDGGNEQHLLVSFATQGSLDLRHAVRVLRGALTLLRGRDDEVKPSVVEAEPRQIKVNTVRSRLGQQVPNSCDDSLRMPPVTSRDFQRVAGQRLTAAETLLREKLTLDAQYIGGYTVECSLKALILDRTPPAVKLMTLKKITAGAKMHRPDVLLGELRTLGVLLPLTLAKRLRRFDWTTDLRYETGRRDTGETNGVLKTAKAVYDWVEALLP